MIQRLVVLIFAAHGVWRAWVSPDYMDFDVYYRAGVEAWTWAQGMLERPLSPDPGSTTPFRYAPVWAWLFAPFAGLDRSLARAIWCAISWLLYAVTLERLGRWFRLGAFGRWVVLMGTLRFAIDNSASGQISSLFTLLLVITATHRSLSGPALALASTLKPYALAFLPLHVRARGRVGAVSFALTLGLAILGSMSLGANAFVEWIRGLARATEIIGPSILGNQSIYGLSVRKLGGGGPFLVALGFAAVYFGRRWIRSGRDAEHGFALLLGLLPIFGILTWKNTYLSWGFPLAWYVGRAPRSAAVIAAGFLLTSQAFVGFHLNDLLRAWGVLPLTALLGLLALEINSSEAAP